MSGPPGYNKYKCPYYWTSILAPPLIMSLGFLLATFYGVSYGITNGVDNGIKRIEESSLAEGMAKQALEGVNKYVLETDFINLITGQVKAHFVDFDILGSNVKDCIKGGTKQ